MAKFDKYKGFTIIEVVLVLAIAGLIFLMVFVALPALQASQRNVQRRKDVDRFASAIIQYQARNRGKIPFYIEKCVDENGGNTYICSKDTIDPNFVSRYIDNECDKAVLDTSYVIPNTEQYPTSSPGVSHWGDRHYKVTSNTKTCGVNFTDPDGTPYKIIVMNGDSDGYLYADNVDHNVTFSAGCKCAEEEGKRIATGKPNDFLIFITLELGQSIA